MITYHFAVPTDHLLQRHLLIVFKNAHIAFILNLNVSDVSMILLTKRSKIEPGQKKN